MGKAYDSLADGFRETIGKICTELGTMGIVCQVTSGRRTIAEQDALYAKGRTAPGSIVTKAKGGQSPHNFGLAADLCPLKNGELWWDAPDDIWNAIHRVAEEHGLVSGYNWGWDKPHMEAPNWKEVQAAWKRGEIDVA